MAAEKLKTPLIIEAINRFESPFGHSLADVWDLIEGCRNPWFEILPDTYHMNIEEVDLLKAIDRFSAAFTSFHVSDNNRFFPGLGAIRFGEVIAQLDRIGYQGKVTIEGNIRTDFIADLIESVNYLQPLLRRS
jgi:sugar phosphate isomerase/epimerase